MTTSATSSGWFIWALLSALFAALTALFARIGPATGAGLMVPALK